MKKLALLLLMMASGLGGIGVAFSHQAAAAGIPRTRSDTPPVYDSSAQQINSLDEKIRNDDKRLLAETPTQELELKRLKIIFLLMMSLDQYRSPSQ